MGVLFKLTEEYFGSKKREEDITPKERLIKDLDNLIDKWVEENNVQFIDTGIYNDEEKKIEIANMDFLAKSDEDADIDYTPLKNLIEYGYDNEAFWRSRPFGWSEDIQRCLEMFGMSEKYQLIRIYWLERALEKPKKDIEFVDDGKKKIIQCEMFDIPIKILAAIKYQDDYLSTYYYGNDYTINTCINIHLDTYHFKPEDNHFKFYRTSDKYRLNNCVRFRLCKKYSNSNY